MPISTLDDYIASSKQIVNITKTATRTSVAGVACAIHDLGGAPGTGTLSGTNTTTGLVPTDNDGSYQTLQPFAAGAKGYISRVTYGSSVSCRIAIHDRLFLAGAFPYNAAATLTSQPSYAARLPGSNYTGLQIWIECVAAFTGTPSFAITYVNQDGVENRTTGTVVAPAALITGRCMMMPLMAGDIGVQKITSITATVANAGTFNVMVLRPLWEGRVRSNTDGDTHDMLRTGLPEVTEHTAIYPLVYTDGTSTGIPSIQVEIANK